MSSWLLGAAKVMLAILASGPTVSGSTIIGRLLDGERDEPLAGAQLRR
jgi:hypothetical protein